MAQVTVFWDGIGHYWATTSAERHGPFTGPDSLDDAITDAKAAGHKIGAVNATRGMLPPADASPLTPKTEEEWLAIEQGRADEPPRRV